MAEANQTVSRDVVVIGAGPAGMAAALTAHEQGAQVLLIERDIGLGGILPQCIHNGFGAITFGQDLPGPEYAHRYAERIQAEGIEVWLDTAVVDLSADLVIHATSPKRGYTRIQARAIVLAMGCRERTRAQIQIPGTRAAGIYTAGTVQRLINIEGYMPVKRALVLGSGDIGMIMARRMTIEGATVLGVAELQPTLTGLRRNYVQCLVDYDIPLMLSTTVTAIHGRNRVEGVETAQVDDAGKPIPGSERAITCDSLVLSVGLIPENELSQQAGVEINPITGGPYIDSRHATNVPGIFAAGNVTTIFDLVDFVSQAGERAGRSAAAYVAANGTAASQSGTTVKLKPGRNIRSVVPNTLCLDDEHLQVALRPAAHLEGSAKVEFEHDGAGVLRFHERYARPAEMIVRELKAKQIEQLKAAAAGDATVEIHLS